MPALQVIAFHSSLQLNSILPEFCFVNSDRSPVAENSDFICWNIPYLPIISTVFLISADAHEQSDDNFVFAFPTVLSLRKTT